MLEIDTIVGGKLHTDGVLDPEVELEEWPESPDFDWAVKELEPRSVAVGATVRVSGTIWAAKTEEGVKFWHRTD